VARALRDDADALNGNHWVAAVHRAAGPDAAPPPCHQPCGGRHPACDAAAGHCFAPLARDAVLHGLTCVRTQAAGDCAIDCMAFWDGVRRGPVTWKRLRLELANFIARHAHEARWQAAFTATGERPPLPLAAAGAALAVPAPSDPSADAAVPPTQPAAGEQGEDAALAAIASLCRLPSGDAALVKRLSAALSPSEKAALLAKSAEPENQAILPVASRRAHIRRRRHDGSLALKRVHGRLFANWCAGRGVDVTKRLPWGTMAKFWATMGASAVRTPRYMLRQAREFLSSGGHVAASSSATAVPTERRHRKCGMQGRPPLAGGLRESLFEWFCSIRGAVATRIPLSCLAAQARLLREECLLQGLRLRVPRQVPKITSRWLLLWRRQYGVSLRRPNRRWKVSRSVLAERLRIVWLNLVRVRELCLLAHGYDPDVDGFDQKPFHFNESGSQGRNTLAYVGAPTVPLKECAASTRARWSATTYVSSNPARFLTPPPLELLFKGGDTILKGLRAAREDLRPAGLAEGSALADLTWLSVAVGVKGSYRTEHVLAYLRQHLPERTADRPWRILMCDMY
ncbi:MAG: hypothetical protein GY772_00615, partial [bacterium]|nr:hypothetical protein [bacterium]